jgi:hypothetical protein
LGTKDLLSNCVAFLWFVSLKREYWKGRGKVKSRTSYVGKRRMAPSRYRSFVGGWSSGE